MIAIWDNGQSYSDETICFIDMGRLDKTQVSRFMELWSMRRGYKDDSYVIAYVSELTMEPGHRYEVVTLTEFTDYYGYEMFYGSDKDEPAAKEREREIKELVAQA